MRNGIGVVGMLLVVGWVACATRARETPGATEAERQALTTDGTQASDGGCAMDSCPDGGSGCLDLAVKATSTGKTFNPRPGTGGWTMCSGQGLLLNSQLNQDLCLDLRDVRSTADGGVVVMTDLASQGNWMDTALPPGQYCLSLCSNKDNDCSKGCKESDCTAGDEQTIRGNLDVVTKVPEPHNDRQRDARP